MQTASSVHQFVTARRYASAVSLCYGHVSVCLTVTSRCSTKTAQWIELIFGTETTFDPSYAVLLQGNSGTPKIRVLHSGTLSKMLELENYATAVGRCLRGAVNKLINTDDGRLYLSHLWAFLTHSVY